MEGGDPALAEGGQGGEFKACPAGVSGGRGRGVLVVSCCETNGCRAHVQPAYAG